MHSFTSTKLSTLRQRLTEFSHMSMLPALLAVSALTLSSSSIAERLLYRVINESGNVELKATISAEEAKRGYKVVNDEGRVIEEVLPELSSEAYDALSLERKKALEEEERKKAELEYNESLLLRYSNIDDLNAEWRRKLQEFDIRISILLNNRAALREKMETQQKQAANLERQNLVVPDVIEKNITDLEREITETNREVEARRQEKEGINSRYERDAERLSLLLARKQGRS